MVDVPLSERPGSRLRLGREFGKFWAAAATSGMGDGISLAAAPLMASRITDDPRLIAGVTIALTAPFALFGIPAGVLVDRFDRRRSMAVVDFARAATMATFALSVALGHLSLAGMYVCFFIIGTGETYFRNASQALVPAIVPPSALVHANGRIVATQATVTQFLGPLAGASLFLVAAGLPFGVDAITFLLSAVLLTRLRPRTRPGPAPARSGPVLRGLVADMATGARWLWRHRLLRTLAAMSGLINFVISGALAVLVVYAHDTLGLSDLGYGMLLATQAVGAMLAAPVAPAVVRRIGRDHALTVVVGAFTAANLILWLVPVWWAAGLAYFVAACGSVTWDVVVITLRQTLIPTGLQGRVNSVYRLVAWGAMPLGAAAAGVVSHSFGPRAVYGFGAALILVAVARTVAGARRRWITHAMAVTPEAS